MKNRFFRWFLWLLVIGWFCAAVFSVYAGFNPSLVVKVEAERFAFPLGICLTCPWFYRQPQNLSGSVLRRLLIWPIGLIFFTMIAWSGMHSGVSLFLTALHGQSSNAVMVIEAKGNGRFRWRDRCESMFLQFKNQQNNLLLKTCPGEEIWQAYSVGQKVQITLRSSALGSYVTQIVRAN